MKDRVIRAVLELITRDRDGDQVSHTEISGVIQSYGNSILLLLVVLFSYFIFTVKLGTVNKNKPLEIYKEDFETPFLNSTREYYARESSVYIAANGVSAYMKKVTFIVHCKSCY